MFLPSIALNLFSFSSNSMRRLRGIPLFDVMPASFSRASNLLRRVVAVALFESTTSFNFSRRWTSPSPRLNSCFLFKV